MTTLTYRKEMRRCGRAACTACRDKPSHGPYWYAYWRDTAGRLQHRYCGKLPPIGALDRSPYGASLPLELALTHVPALAIRCLGSFEVTLDGRAVTLNEWRRADARRLLALLLLHPEGASRDEAAEALWPERDPEASATALKHALTALRQTLEPANRAEHHAGLGSYRLPAGASLLQLHLTGADFVDLHAFEGAGDASHLSSQRLEELVSLYQGDLLPDFRYEEWTIARRESLHLHWQGLTLELAERLAADGRRESAIAHLRRLLEDDGTHEAAARLLMTILESLGRRDEALRVHATLVATLERELGVVPDEATKALAGRLRADDRTMHEHLHSADDTANTLRTRIEALQKAEPSAATDRRLAELWGGLACALDEAGEPEAALGAAESGLLITARHDLPAAAASLHLAAAAVRCHQGLTPVAQELAETAQELARRADRPELAAQAVRLRARCAQQSGLLDKAIDLARESAALHDSLGDREGALHSRHLAALCLWYAGRFAAAATMHRRNRDEARDLQAPERQAYALCGLGSSLLHMGELESAEAHLSDALSLAENLGDRFLELSVEYHLADLWAERAWLTADEATGIEAARRFERVISLARSQGSEYMAAFATIDLAMLLAERGEIVAARTHVQCAADIASTMPNSTAARGWALLAAGTVDLAAGKGEVALRATDDAIPLLEAASPAGLAAAHRVAAAAQTTLGRLDLAEQRWIASASAAAHRGQALETLRTERARAMMRTTAT